jgi:hypothetical protein
MSFHIYAQDLPTTAKSVHDIPDDFVPNPLGKVEDIEAAILSVAPNLQRESRQHAVIVEAGYSIEIFISIRKNFVKSITFSVRGTDDALNLVSDLLIALKCRALCESEVFELNTAKRSFAHWKGYRDQVISNA